MTATPLRVLYDLRGAQSPFHPERGIARWTREHAQALAARDDVTVYGLVDPAMPDAGLDTGTPILTVPIADAGVVRDRDRPTVHHIGSPFELELTMASMLPGALQRPDVLRSATLFDVIPLAWPIAQPGPARRWRVRAQLLRTTRSVLAISEFSARDGARRLAVPRERIHVVGTGVTPRPAAAPAGDAGAERYLLYAGGTEHPRKNLPRLVEAYARLAPALRETHRLVIAGRVAPAMEAELRDAAARHGVADRVELPGFVSDDRLTELMAGCACFVYPSLYEGFGLPIVEAMSAGAPVVHSGTTSCGEIPGPPAARFDPADPGAIAGAVARVLTDPVLARHLRERGAATAARYGWDEVAERSVEAWRADLEDIERRARGRTPRVSWTLTMVAPSTPGALSPASAMHLLAGAASERVQVQLATPAPIRPRDGWMGPLAPRRHPVAPAWRPGAIVHLVDTAEDAAAAARLLRGVDGAAVVWELDRVVGGDRRHPSAEGVLALRRLADASVPLLVRDVDDAEWLAAIAPALEGRVGLLPMPLGWVASGGGLGHEATLETALMLGPGRAEVRRERSVPVVVTGRPDRLGPVRAHELDEAARLAAEMALAGTPVRFCVLGTMDGADAAQAEAAAGAAGAPGALLTGAWPSRQEMVAWATTMAAAVRLPSQSRATRNAMADLAACAGVPLADDGAPGIARALRQAEGPGRGIPPERRPEAVADALLSALGR